MDCKLKPIAIIGCGVMGVGIAATAVGYGINVAVVDVDENALQSAQKRLDLALRHGRLLAAFPEGRKPGQLRTANSLSSIGDCSAIIEAVNEDADVKMRVLRELQSNAPRDKPIVTNTSGIPIDTLAASLLRPECLIGVHFMNPAYLIKTVEVAKGSRTANSTLLATNRVLESMERKAIVVRDSPGFVTSRLLHSMINDAARLVGEQVATAEQIDSLMKGCLGHSTGPLRTADLIGLDNLLDSLNALFGQTNDTRYKPSTTLLELVAEGSLGQKTGKGFYEYREV